MTNQIRRANTVLARRLVTVHLWAIALCDTVLPGCGPPTVGSFETAERLAAQQQRAIFVFYKSWLSAECGKMQDQIRKLQVQQQLADKIVCILDEGYHPNRRFVLRYGVDRYPAVIVIHPDGSYNSRMGTLTARQIAEFINTAAATGQMPRLGHTAPPTSAYAWHKRYAAALQEAHAQRRSLFVFYETSISAESSEMRWTVLNRPEVAQRFTNTVNCRLDWVDPANRKLMAKYGITNVPAFLIINPDGTYHTHQGQLSADELIEFSKRAMPGDAQ